MARKELPEFFGLYILYRTNDDNVNSLNCSLQKNVDISA